MKYRTKNIQGGARAYGTKLGEVRTGLVWHEDHIKLCEHRFTIAKIGELGYFRNQEKSLGGGMIQHFPSMCEALGSISSLQECVGGGCPVEQISTAGPATHSTWNSVFFLSLDKQLIFFVLGHVMF